MMYGLKRSAMLLPLVTPMLLGACVSQSPHDKTAKLRLPSTDSLSAEGRRSAQHASGDCSMSEKNPLR